MPIRPENRDRRAGHWWTIVHQNQQHHAATARRTRRQGLAIGELFP